MTLRLLTVALMVAFALAQLAACGDGDGHPPEPPRAPRPTTFIGSLNRAAAAPGAVEPGAATAVPAAVQVCVAGTGFCTEVDESGAFTLAGDVGGDVVLEFEGPGFSAVLVIGGIPRGATVRIENIVCDLGSGQCHAVSVEIVAAPNTPPDCSLAMAQPSVLWPPNHAMVPIAITGVVDADGEPVTITATHVTQNEAEDAPGSGNTAPDARLDPLAVRAERSGQGEGRIYTISFVATDGRGGTCAGVVHVCVPHDQGRRGATCG